MPVLKPKLKLFFSIELGPWLCGGPKVAVGALDVLAQVHALGVILQPGGGRGDERALLAFVGHLSRV